MLDEIWRRNLHNKHAVLMYVVVRGCHISMDLSFVLIALSSHGINSSYLSLSIIQIEPHTHTELCPGYVASPDEILRAGRRGHLLYESLIK